MPKAQVQTFQHENTDRHYYYKENLLSTAEELQGLQLCAFIFIYRQAGQTHKARNGPKTAKALLNSCLVLKFCWRKRCGISPIPGILIILISIKLLTADCITEVLKHLKLASNPLQEDNILAVCSSHLSEKPVGPDLTIIAAWKPENLQSTGPCLMTVAHLHTDVNLVLCHHPTIRNQPSNITLHISASLNESLHSWLDTPQSSFCMPFAYFVSIISFTVLQGPGLRYPACHFPI